jgi:hypothetical protein
LAVLGGLNEEREKNVLADRLITECVMWLRMSVLCFSHVKVVVG